MTPAEKKREIQLKRAAQEASEFNHETWDYTPPENHSFVVKEIGIIKDRIAKLEKFLEVPSNDGNESSGTTL